MKGAVGRRQGESSKEEMEIKGCQVLETDLVLMSHKLTLNRIYLCLFR